MKLRNFITTPVKAVIATALKGIRSNLDETQKKLIIENGLYHITPNREITDKIVESQHLRPSDMITSYGAPCVFFFNGTPTIENYMKNLTNTKKETNPFLNPAMVVSALKISPTNKFDLENFKVRPFDDVIMHEGVYALPNNKVKPIFLVPDLVRNNEDGNPIINPETGTYDIKFREALPEELNDKKTQYDAKSDYIHFIKNEAIKLGYKNKGIFKNLRNSVQTIKHLFKIEGIYNDKNLLPTIKHIIKHRKKSEKNKELNGEVHQSDLDNKIKTTR
ncbi:MAG: hypothetical protein J6A89_06695 [Clostridia bacterium]|nr:hypothetical protein [Clostridia bacterium]